MSYTAGSINDVNPGAALYTALAVDLAAAGFTLEDTVVISTRTHKVWKSPAGSNVAGLDWFLDVHYTTTGAGTLRFTVFEDFNAGTDTAYRGPYTTNSTTIDATTYSRFGSTGSALETNWLTTAASVTLAASTLTGYWFSATPDRVILLTTVQTSSLLYAGLFDPTADHASHAGAALFPLVVATLTTGDATAGSQTASLTRMPTRATGTVNWNQHVNISTTVAAMLFGGQVGVAASEATGLVKIVPLPIRSGMGAAGLATTADFVGTIIDVGGGYLSGAAVRGDTLTADGDTWIATSPASSVGLFFRAV